MLELLASDYRPLIQDALTYSILAAAFFWGAGPERAMIATWVVFFELVPIPYDAFWGGSYQLQSTDAFLATTDLCAGIVWILIALYANRNYPLFVAALQLLALGAHLARGLIDAISPVAYAVMYIGPGWLQLLLMAAGMARHAWRERRFGPYREWRVELPWLAWLSTRTKKV
ncbi:MAG: hypothetical protein HRT64_10035 [Erythrobacter sp.]|nr:hypothetical protein [Erythrobacter sp.]